MTTSAARLASRWKGRLGGEAEVATTEKILQKPTQFFTLQGKTPVPVPE